ncbi:hypothetical protein F5146DRAFT_999190 [Armillaria mellea]|nr:hypothetical protein F5146DRAFT_999190 [Armillaria mellea]
MSTFLDLEASVAHEEVEFSDSEDDDNDFIADEEEWGHGDTTDSPTADLFADILTPSVEEDRWGNLLERARVHASNSKILLDSSEGFKFGLLDAPPGLWVLSCWPGWEDIVVFHIGRCARPEQGIKAAFIMPLIEEQVWLEADMSADLKSWLVDIPGVVRRNQQVVLHAVSHEESRHTLSSTLPPVVIPGSWIKVRRGPSKGDIGMIGDKITDTSRGQSGAIHGIGEQSLEVDFAEGLFSVKWADCRKDFHIGQYVEISEQTVGDRWSGWISTVENETLELICPHGSTVVEYAHCSSYNLSKFGSDTKRTLEGDEGPGDQEELSLGWKDGNEGQTYPESEPFLLAQQAEVPGNATPLPDPLERCLSPAWNPSSPDPPSHCASILSCWIPNSFVSEMSVMVKLWILQGCWLYSLRSDTMICFCLDLIWTVAVIILRAPFLLDDVTGETLTLHNLMMTLAKETKESKVLNSNLKNQLRVPLRD